MSPKGKAPRSPRLDEKAMLEALRLSESRLQAIINAEPACVKLVSLDGRLLDMNPAGLAMIDASDLSQVVGRSIVDIVHPDDRGRFLEIHQAASRAEPAAG